MIARLTIQNLWTLAESRLRPSGRRLSAAAEAFFLRDFRSLSDRDSLEKT
jgi:hypothetical protein